MIKVNRGLVEVNGTKKNIKTELSVLVHALYYDEILSIEEIEKCFEMGKKSDKEIEEEVNKKIKKFLNKLFD